ncbi:MAG: hypothetical protein ACE5KK_02550 [Candidatus Brocadiales bacterium]
MTKKMKILIPIMAIVLLGVLAFNIYFSVFAKKPKLWRTLKEKPSATEEVK